MGVREKPGKKAFSVLRMQLTRVVTVWDAFGGNFCGGGASDNGGRERVCEGVRVRGDAAGKEFFEAAGGLSAELDESL